MIVYMIDDQGRARIAKLVNHEIARQGRTAKEVGSKGMPSVATIKRIKAGEDVTPEMLDALGGRLGLPRDFILYVGTGDVRRIKASRAEDDLIRWVLDLIAEDRPNTGSRRRGKTG